MERVTFWSKSCDGKLIAHIRRETITITGTGSLVDIGRRLHGLLAGLSNRKGREVLVEIVWGTTRSHVREALSLNPGRCSRVEITEGILWDKVEKLLNGRDKGYDRKRNVRRNVSARQA